jgi:putative iron-only hydrogenase system regulator
MKEIATLGIMVENFEKIAEVNALLHRFSECIICRMGMPYEKRNVRLIHVVLDTNEDDALALSEKLNALDGVCAQVMFL